MANTLAAVDAGATHVQGTANGYGERAGNANIFSVIGGLVTKMGCDVLPDGCLAEMVRVSHAIAEIANLAPDTHPPYVGASAFAHKAGLHASAIKVAPRAVQPPGPDRRRQRPAHPGHRDGRPRLGRAEVGASSASTWPGVPTSWPRSSTGSRSARRSGWSYEAADASFELLVRDELGDGGTAPFTVESYRVIVDRREDGRIVSEATVKVQAGRTRVIVDRGGQRPGQRARPGAARGARRGATRELAEFELTDYKVRILPGKHGTDAVTRVLVETSDRHREWTTVGVHANVIEASWLALHDAVRYGLLREPN